MEMISNSLVTAVTLAFDRAVVVKLVGCETDVTAVFLDTGRAFSGVAFTGDALNSGSGEVGFCRETGVVVDISGVAFTDDASDSGSSEVGFG